MTLILAYSNLEFVAMAADRKITRAGIPEDDDRTKTLIWGRVIFGFTGLADLGRRGQHTMEWLAHKLVGYGTDFETNELAQSLTSVVRITPVVPEDKGLTILGVGYQSERIVYILISNMYSEHWQRLANPGSTFRASIVYPEVRSTIRAAGIRMPPNVLNDLKSRLRRTHQDRLPSQETVSAILAGAIQASAGRYVGDTALITTATSSGEAVFDVVTPKSKPGQTVDVASPYFVSSGMVMVLPPQRMRRSLRRPSL